MPNQLSKNKRRFGLAEHAAVLAVLNEVARHEGTTAAALFRAAVRELVGSRAADPDLAARLRGVAMDCAPRPPHGSITRAKLARYKRELREFDHAMLDLRLAAPDEIQDRNSLLPRGDRLRILDLEADDGQS